MKNKNYQRFYYNKELEYALCQLFGLRRGKGKQAKPGKYEGTAGIFSDPSKVKIAMKDAIRKLRKRIDEVAYNDERLKTHCLIVLGSIEKHINNIKKENHDWKIISNFLYLVAVLLGYDWLDGKPNRHIIYYQDLSQHRRDFDAKHPEEFSKMLKEVIHYDIDNMRKIIIKDLKKKGFSIPYIALIMKMGESTIQKIFSNK